MNIQEIEIENVRGITHWQEEFDDKNVRILGPNGSGKSSVIQSVEFVLTGDISRLRGSGTQGIPFAEYASHVGADPDEAWVRATFAHNTERNVTLKRWVSDRDNPEIIEPEELDEIPEWLQLQMDAAELGHSILDRDRLLRFVTAQEGKRGDRIDELFGIEEIDKKRKSLKGAKNKHDRERLEARKTEKKNAAQRFFDLFPSVVSTRSGALEQINKRREEHGSQPIESLEDDFAENIEVGRDLSVDALQSEAIVSLLKQVANRYKQRRKEFRKGMDELQSLSTQLAEEEHLERELNTIDLLDTGISLIDEYDQECPLCLNSWNEAELREHLKGRRSHAEQLEDLVDKLDTIYDSLNDVLVNHSDNLSKLKDELEDDYPTVARQIAGVVETTNSWKGELNHGPITDFPDTGLDEDDLFPGSLISEFERLVSVADEKPELKSATENVDLLVRADDRYQELSSKEDELETAREVQAALEDIHQHFLDARSRVLNEAFSEIRERFEEYYSQMHQDEEAADFSAILEPTDTGVKFEPGFYDQGHHHPGAVHSEGHRDSMGLALFLAMTDVGGSAIDILLLDDVMMSIDSGHRSNVANLLAEDISDRYQILLTTHDKTWNRHLHLTQEFDKEVRFSKCSFEGGPLPVGSLSDPWDRIEHHLMEDDVTAAAAWIRKTVEWYSRRACASLKAKVPYHELEDENLNLGRLFQSAINEYMSLLEEGDPVTETDYDQSLYDEADVQRDLESIETIKNDKDRYLNLLNRNVHHNDPEAAFYSAEELKNERDVFRRAYDLLHCSDCNSWVKRGRYVYCDCTIRVNP